MNDVLAAYRKFFIVPGCQVEWEQRSADAIGEILAAAAEIMHGEQIERHQDDVTKMRKWKPWQRWFMTLVRWHPHAVQPITDIKKGIADQCYAVMIQIAPQDRGDAITDKMKAVAEQLQKV